VELQPELSEEAKCQDIAASLGQGAEAQPTNPKAPVKGKKLPKDRKTI
jgi:hypothetical protein